jgi:uncharacterized protein YecT (DUF1311 family)
MRRFFPSEQRKANLEDNRARLEIMEKLGAMGYDPDLARHADKDVEHFMAVLRSQQNAFVETQVEKIVAHQTQLELNEDAADRAEVARVQMNRILRQIEIAEFITDEQKAVLPVAQAAWEEYAKRQAYHRGSMRPMVYHGEVETLVTTRTAELQRIYDEQSQQ